MKKIILIITLVFGVTLNAQQTPAPPQSEQVAIIGATAHIGNGEVIENCTIIFNDGKITAIGAGLTAPTEGTTINAEGKHVYPGFIAPSKSLGLVEVDAVRASDDQDEIGEMIPHVRSLIAYNAESKVVESMRPNGVLIGQITPQGGTISGTSSIVQFDAWNWEDAALKTDDGIHMNWPNFFRRGRWWAGEERGFIPNKEYAKEIDDIKMFFQNSIAYGKTGAGDKNLPFAAMQGLFDGSQRLYIHADGEKEMTDAVTLAKNMGVKNVVIVGGYRANKIAGFLKEHNIPVLVNVTHSLPEFDDDDYDLTYKLPKLLVDAGLLVAIQNEDMANFQTRNMAFYAGQTVAQGLDKETALQLITGNTAKILGIDDMYGTLEEGKSATLFISEGDALDMRTNKLSKAYIDGRDISLETHQTELWKRYMGKYERQQEGQ
ncbi:MAG: amidohydrolase family protein [Muricauda sp.]|nr:amidohydrolase family protein [Allomuricauda sp.]MBO6588830.1 amidohydrolase family protein [Allomuricauda sp.]MBO6618031.1 amidohydrolase family protein [Allomuricauda sp.]MBO6644368.1 amidohydrolase family protein [Allomuricauda sp.]MBO6747945.1 amidohydrolase family protein [Allomuricauda sp.]MBO6844328.1 amidohydrolase family protein [Allomuricauda sp.]